MFKLATFRSETAFWPLAEPGTPAEVARPRSLLSALLWGLLAAPRRLGAMILCELEARRAVQTLASLDDRMLRDMGVERDQIAHACRHGREALLRSAELRADFARWS